MYIDSAITINAKHLAHFFHGGGLHCELIKNNIELIKWTTYSVKFTMHEHKYAHIQLSAVTVCVCHCLSLWL